MADTQDDVIEALEGAVERAKAGWGGIDLSPDPQRSARRRFVYDDARRHG